MSRAGLGTAARGMAAVLLVLACAAQAARGGPVEARRRLDDARHVVGDAWAPRVRAFRQAIEAANPTDRTYARAIAGVASALERAGLVHGAIAFAERRARLGPRRDRARLDATMDLALLLRREGDLETADPLLDEVLDLARPVSAHLADRALEARSEDAFEARDLAALRTLSRRARKERAAPSVRIAVHDELGRLLLLRGDRRGAARALEEAEADWRDAAREDGPETARTARRWLDLALRRRLATTGDAE